MNDRKRANRDSKLRVNQIIAAWVTRTGLKRESLSAIAGLPDYNHFYKAYLDTSRPVSRNPDRALGVVRAVTENLPQERRATARDVLLFLAETCFPHDRISEVAALFTPDEWEAASGQLPPTDRELGRPGSATSTDLATRLGQLEEAIRRLSPPARSDEELLAAATARLTTMPDALPEPQALPVPHRMPLIRGRLFAGRDDQLRQLAGLLRTQRPGEIVAITGMGGIGKTSLASELVHRWGQFFAGGVFWVSCAQPQMVVWEVAACGETGLVQHDEWASLPPEERARLVSLAWQEPLPRLLVFDGCEDDATLRRWRPTSGGCRVVLTSQRSRWSRGLGITTLALDELSIEASIALLRGYRPDLPTNALTLEAIAHEVGGLPLALHLAGSYLETYQDDPLFGDPMRFLQDLRAAGPLAHAALSGVDVALSPTDHELSVGRTFALSLARLDPGDAQAQQARALLARAAYFAPGEPFPSDVLAAATALGEAARPVIGRLADLGLVNQERSALRIHRLVAAYARSALADATAPGAVRRALTLKTEQAYAQRDAATARQLLPHLSLHAHDEQPLAVEETVALWNALPFALELDGDLAGGLTYLQRAHTALLQEEIIETSLGAQVLNNLAEWHRALGAVSTARPLHEQALAIRQAILPADDLALGESQLNLGETLREEGLLDQAQQAYERALAIGLLRGGSAHEITLAARNQLALLLFSREHYAEARRQFEQLITATGAAFGPDDPRTATVRNNLATTCARMGDYAQACAVYEVVVAHLTSRLGEEHPDTLRARLNAARALVQSGGLLRGAAELRKLIGLLATAYGDDHLFTQTAQETLAEVEMQLGSGTGAVAE